MGRRAIEFRRQSEAQAERAVGMYRNSEQYGRLRSEYKKSGGRRNGNCAEEPQENVAKLDIFDPK
jgi:hypothetical protein